ncbi:hypothetical protein J0H58_13320 [bacterium]|nr:hypothetical protein [bacterium]
MPDADQGQDAAPPARSCSDQMYERNSRQVYAECYVESIFRGGVPTGEYRACRRRSQGGLEQVTFATREEALGWGKRR